jgi:mRNA interferase MazF
MTAAKLARRQVVLLPFPFSDLSASKLRPALVLADAGRGDWLLCQITSQPFGDVQAVTLLDSDFVQGGLRMSGFVMRL